MTRRVRRIFLAGIAGMLAIALAVFLTHPDIVRDRVAPRDATAMAAWLAKHPADWLTATQLTEAALDSPSPRRGELWRAAYALARATAPRSSDPLIAFVRGGLFHWYELSAADRKAVLASAAPLMRDARNFDELHRPLWELTHDLAWLRRNAPGNIGALDQLREIAAANGLFADYRALRDAMRRQRLVMFETTRSTLPAHELPQLLPRRLETEDEPLVRRILAELKHRSFEPERFGDPTGAMIEYAVRHQLPVDGLTPFVEAQQGLPAYTRARLALVLGNPDAATNIELTESASSSPEWQTYHLERAELEARQGDAVAANHHLALVMVVRPDAEVIETAIRVTTALHDEATAAQLRGQLHGLMSAPRQWIGTCGDNELCGAAHLQIHTQGEPVTITAAAVQSDQIAPYIEIYADDARVAEGEVAEQRRFTIALPEGVHRLEVRLVNPRIANGAQRRVRLS